MPSPTHVIDGQPVDVSRSLTAVPSWSKVGTADQAPAAGHWSLAHPWASSDDEAGTQSELRALVQRVFLPVGTATDGDRSVVFLSPDGDSAERSSLSVAEALAHHTQRSVSIVDANLRAPVLHRHFALGNALGFADMLGDTCTVRTVSTLIAPAVWAVTAGQRRPGESAEPGAYARALARLLDAFDFVIVAAASLGVRSEALELARAADGAVLVVDQQTTRRDTARRSVAVLRAADVRLRGVVFRPAPVDGPRRRWWRI